MMTYQEVLFALNEIRITYDIEITKWYRIRRRALKRGHTDLANKILEEIRRAEQDVTNTNFWAFKWQYKFLFQMDKPVDEYR